MTTLDLDRLRAETPGVAHRIHLNNAGAALMPAPVLDAIRDHLDLEARIGGYEAADERAAEIAEAHRSVERLLNAPTGTVAFLDSATAAFNAALSSIPFRAGDVLLTTRNDYASNQIAFLSLQRRMGIRVVRAPDTDEGGVDVAQMETLVHRLRPRLVSITHVPTNSGLVQPVADVCRICRDRDVPVIVDACQSVGQIPLDVEALDCDFLSATARKFLRGPRGIGFLYVSDRILSAGLEPLLPDMRAADWIEEDLYQPAPDARRFEWWERAYALVLGLGAAARYAEALGIEAVGRRIRALSAHARESLASISQVRVLDRGPDLCGIVTVTVGTLDPAEVVGRLRSHGINTSVSPREAGVLDFDEKGVEGAVRISPHCYNTADDIERLTEAIAALV
ncbi:MAG: aminotransferase class V-fold PLP-dependent enzyme [Gemmatimonadota bacterium]|nr:aminotransferase class V-fold PLP-dependent enzyme [Gemmatimonadota bacterium]